MRTIKIVLTAFAVLLGTWHVSPVQAKDSDIHRSPASAPAALSDLLFIRPLSVVGSGLTTSIFLLTLPVTYPIDRGYTTSTALVQKPWSFTANRSLGIFRPEKDVTEVIDAEIDDLYGEFLGRTNANLKPIDLE